MVHDDGDARPADDTPTPHPKRPTSRRDFFRAAGFGVAGLAAGGAVAGGIAAATASNPQEDYGFTPLSKRSEPGFDHVVVVMFENRSFDHMLGWLYPAGGEPAGQTFDGLAQGDYSNPGESGEPVPARVYTGPTDQIMTQPDPDPGEFYPHVNTTLARGRKPTPEEYSTVMGGPQTFCNRVFRLSAPGPATTCSAPRALALRAWQLEEPSSRGSGTGHPTTTRSDAPTPPAANWPAGQAFGSPAGADERNRCGPIPARMRKRPGPGPTKTPRGWTSLSKQPDEDHAQP